ncbi:MAG: F-box protein [Holosporales bacterium]
MKNLLIDVGKKRSSVTRAIMFSALSLSCALASDLVGSRDENTPLVSLPHQNGGYQEWNDHSYEGSAPNPSSVMASPVMDNQVNIFDMVSALPAELSQTLFTYLSREEVGRLRLVSRAWREISESPWVWRQLQQQDRSIKLTPRIVKNLCADLELSPVLRVTMETQHGPYTIQWGARSSCLGKTVLRTELLSPNEKDEFCVVTSDRYEARITQPNFHPVSIKGFQVPSINAHQIVSWEKLFKDAQEESPDLKIMPKWEDPETGVEWGIDEALIVSRAIYDEESAQNSEIFEVFKIHDEVPDLKIPTKNVSKMVSIECAQSLPVDDENYGLVVMKANFDLCDLMYYSWRLNK